VFEQFAILAAGVLTLAAVIVQHLHTVTTRGPGFALTNRTEALDRTGFSGRATRTVQNSVESSVMFVPPALIVLLSGQSTGLSMLAAQAYIVSRVVFTLAYWAGIARLRSPAWAVSIAAILAMSWTALTAVLDL